MLTTAVIEQILTRIPKLTIGVIGDLFLDRYLDIDAVLTEPSIETGLDAYQVVHVRSYPGAAGTVINNLAALGVGRIHPIAVIGDDGEGYELRQALVRLNVVDISRVFVAPERRTPTYTKPMLHQTNQTARELNRLDIKNRAPLPAAEETRVAQALTQVWSQLDALLVLDQVSEAECGVITTGIRERLAELSEAHHDMFILADSRERIRLFRSLSLKPNERECGPLLGTSMVNRAPFSIQEAVRQMASRVNRPVFCTRGDEGITLAVPSGDGTQTWQVPSYPVPGPIDVVGAGDSVSAGIACAVAAGASWEQAAAFGNLVASITVQQLGTTGTASPEQVRQRWREVGER